MSVTTFTKDPGDHLDYDLDFSRWLTDGDTLVNAAAVIEGTVLVDGVEEAGTATITSVTSDDMAVKVWVDGGTLSENDLVTVTAESLLGRTKVSTFKLRIRD